MLEKLDEETVRKEQLSILSSQLEILVGNSVWSEGGKKSMIQTANQIRNIIKKSEGDGISEEIGVIVEILTKAKVKALMSNDCDYYNLCTKFDAIISNIKKYQGGVHE